ncbi:protein mono-ADP-ribosyltransferase PARP15-like [Watersipora subatra]|uniref:protein mono-ADP-ribosyltransferase PARP15-like n=1 Tax=Watersipora subatra TaxID=2589382 RepID=UPI00355C18A1
MPCMLMAHVSLQEDLVVISTSSKDPVAEKIKQKAGHELQRVCSKFNTLTVGSIKETQAYNMTCKNIIHFNCPPSQDGNTDALQGVVKACLGICTVKKYRSIAFAPDSFTSEDYAADVVADSVLAAIADFSQQHPQSCLITIKFYLSPDSTTTAVREADFIINSTGSHMALSGGKTSLALLNKAGQALQEECNRHAPIITGDIVMTEGFGLPYDTKAESLALPPIGTGLLEYPPQSVARCVVHAVADFARLNRKSLLKSISLVIFSADESAIEGVEQALDFHLEEQITGKVDMTSTLQDGKTIVDLPNPWENPVHEFRECRVRKGTREYKDVITDLNKTLNRPTATIIEVKRIQNPETYPLYDTMRKSVARKLNKQEAEVETAPLWHGTSESSVSKIVRTKFDRGTAGAGSLLGAGTYFSVSANYSSQQRYSPANAAGERYIILSRVITGESCLGTPQLTTLKLYKPDNPFVQYDSAVDNLAKPTMYAVFHDASAYPDVSECFTEVSDLKVEAKSISDELKVFKDVQALATSCVDGYHMCIFAYGQTGSDKPHAMEDKKSELGISERALIQLFDEAAERSTD